MNERKPDIEGYKKRIENGELKIKEYRGLKFFGHEEAEDMRGAYNIIKPNDPIYDNTYSSGKLQGPRCKS